MASELQDIVRALEERSDPPRCAIIVNVMPWIFSRKDEYQYRIANSNAVCGFKNATGKALPIHFKPFTL